MKKLYRSAADNYVFGILGGIGEYFQVDSTLLRLAFVFFVLVTGFFPGGLAYLIAYFIVPENPKDIVKEDARPVKDHHHNHAAASTDTTETELL